MIILSEQTTDFRTPQMKRNSYMYHTLAMGRLRICLYQRVSTNHRQQRNALKNQVLRTNALTEQYPWWDIVNEFRDEAVSAKGVKKREAFQTMYEEAEAYYKKTGKPLWDIIVCTEICRFSRKLKNTLDYVDRYHEMGIELFFYYDNLWTWAPDAPMRLAIFGGLAESETSRLVDRVNQGMETCRKKGVLFGSGNILGYDLVRPDENDKTKNYYVPNSDSKTVHDIFTMYRDGWGEKRIASALTEGHYRNASGEVRWSASYISRVLNNHSYIAEKSYMLSCMALKDGEWVRTKLPEEEHIYIPGGWQPIIERELWDEVQRIKKGKKRIGVSNGVGKRPTTDCWMKVLKCDCGHSYAKFKWRVNQTGEECFGFQCRNIVANRRRSFYIANGLSGDGRCDVKSIPEWKLQYQFLKILKLLWQEPDSDTKTIEAIIDEAYETEDSFVDETPRITKQIEILKKRMATLIDKYLDGMITEDIYNEKYNDIKDKIGELEENLSKAAELAQEHANKQMSVNYKLAVMDEVRQQLVDVADILKGKFNAETLANLVPTLVDRVTPTEAGEFRWYLSIGSNDNLTDLNAREYSQLLDFEIGYDEAKAFRKSTGRYLRLNQWQNVHVVVMIRS